MRSANRKSRLRKRRILLCTVIVYGLVSVFFYCKNVLMADEQVRVEDERSSLRAFYTAPPVVPHEIESRGSQDCLRCHLDVTRTEDGRIAMQTPHPELSNCTQCHVSGMQTTNEKPVVNTWEGLDEPKRGDRLLLMSPPTVPHRIYLRENCLSCHGPENPNMQLRTTHPQRTNCLQCHVPNVHNEF